MPGDGTDEIILDDNQNTTEDEETRQTSTEDDSNTEDETEEEKPKVDWESEDNPYKKKYSESSKEVQENLLPKIQAHEKVIKDNADALTALTTERDQILEKLKAEKPETYDNVTLKKQLDSNSRQLAELTEKSALDDFIASTPLAKSFRDKLKNYARANPSESLPKIWDDVFKAGAEAQAQKDQEEKDKKKKSKTETGGGNSTGDPGEEKVYGSQYTLKEFNKLPVMKRREIMVKAGVKL